MRPGNPIAKHARHAGPAGLGAVALCATAALAVAGCGSGSSISSSSGSGAPASLTAWRMGASTPAQVTWMNGVASPFHKDYPAYAKTTVKVVYVPWTTATTAFASALSSGKNAPDVTEIGNTETPANASLGMLANITSEVNGWSNKSDVVPGMLANDTQNGSSAEERHVDGRAELAAVRGRPEVLCRPLPHQQVSSRRTRRS